jgi:hypothetical protein
MQSIATADLGTRPLANADEIGLTAEELRSVAAVVGEWRRRYIAYAEEVVQLGIDIDAELLEDPGDVAKVRALAAKRRDVIGDAEGAFFDAWIALDNAYDHDKRARLPEVYAREFARLPHPILGTSGHEGPLGGREGESADRTLEYAAR